MQRIARSSGPTHSHVMETGELIHVQLAYVFR